LKEELNCTKWPFEVFENFEKKPTRDDLDFDLGKRGLRYKWGFSALHVRIFCGFTHPISQNQASSVKKNVFRVACCIIIMQRV
jgi:hypothetical protein